jgi:protein phosphatase
MHEMDPESPIPDDALVLLVGPAGSGKSTWARARFRPAQIVSSDDLRELVSDDPADQSATRDAFTLLHLIARARTARGLLTVVDATNLLASSRKPLLELARRHDRPVLVVVFEVPIDELLARNAGRERVVPEATVRHHHALLASALHQLPTEGYVSIIRG